MLPAEPGAVEQLQRNIRLAGIVTLGQSTDKAY